MPRVRIILSIWACGVLLGAGVSFGQSPSPPTAPPSPQAIELGSVQRPQPRAAGIHTAPIIVQAQKIRQATNYPLQTYRLFRTGANGDAVPIPFQIDEINQWSDYVLDQGGRVTADTGNGLYDGLDELAFMGDDVGPKQAPKRWPKGEPSVLFELSMEYLGATGAADQPSQGAVYLAVYFFNAPAPSDRRYVNYLHNSGEVVTSRYRYKFDQKNHLAVRGVEMIPRQRAATPDPTSFVRLLDSSTFFMRANLKYFVTVEVNHRSVRSMIEAYKVGPVRSIVRVSFYYEILRLNFELGMYTEVSFFSNSVVLPAIMYNPLDGPKSLNQDSGFYYGFAVMDNPSTYDIQTNMEPYQTDRNLLDRFRREAPVEPLYWISARGPDRMMYVEIAPSQDMQKAGIRPYVYTEAVDAAVLKKRPNDQPLPLGRSPVNLGLYFGLSRFKEGEHHMAFRLFFENMNDPKVLDTFRNLSRWSLQATRL